MRLNHLMLVPEFSEGALLKLSRDSTVRRANEVECGYTPVDDRRLRGLKR